MPEVTIGDIRTSHPASTPYADADVFELEQSAESKGGTMAELFAYVEGKFGDDPLAVPHVVVTASKTFALTDANKEQQVTAAAEATLTIAADASVDFPRGTKLAVISFTDQTINITAAAGVTLNGVTAGSTTVDGEHGAVVLTKGPADTWKVNGAFTGVT
jgi:hypothetical protein